MTSFTWKFTWLGWARCPNNDCDDRGDDANIVLAESAASVAITAPPPPPAATAAAAVAAADDDDNDDDNNNNGDYDVNSFEFVLLNNSRRKSGRHSQHTGQHLTCLRRCWSPMPLSALLNIISYMYSHFDSNGVLEHQVDLVGWYSYVDKTKS